MEINKAPYEMLIRVPGIGIRGAKKIVSARRVNSLNFLDLKKLGIVLKRAQYFITCRGKYFGAVSFDELKIKKALKPKVDLNYIDEDIEQISFFDAPSISENNKLLLLNDKSTSLTGEL